eukprot:CAMPEP_0194216924 /NCGR_PEP_ID=MMETSP0156-20130528/20023_1 /TAXON_ID=33649 /ORGANISM="Thalassionema nitzschioides, Strain L26-B" /LENGTH=127 /DNA_ID=CAMNT_0038945813 /DNA_START=49 /DNA_END=429 /DNA_ORIENTATION=+
MYFHRLAPFGKVDFETSSGQRSTEDLGSTTFDCGQFVKRISQKTELYPSRGAFEVSQYIFYMSLVIQKDWGTGGYVLSHKTRANCLQDHYAVTTKLHSLTPAARTKEVIKTEIRAKRPLMMHLRDTA